jgi:hypothetical protein
MNIYKITNLVNNKIYVGQSIFDDPRYLGSGKIIKKAIKKYGIQNFKKEIIEKCLSKDELDQREIYWIEKLKSRDPKIGYNISIGGSSPMKDIHHSEKSKQKVSYFWKGRKRSQENINKLSISKKGLTLSDETKNKISESSKGKIPWNKGLKTPEDVKKKQSLAKLGKNLSKEHVEKISSANKGRKNTEESKANIKLGWEKRRNKNN